MPELLVALITGFTTGGLSCMAVQGGLLASTLANQIEADLSQQGKRSKRTKPRNIKIALPILLFLVSKLIVYTLLGALLGGLGQLLQLTPTVQAVLQFLIAVFMIGNALRMLNVHPFFRIFSFEPPAAVTRFIRRKARGEAAWSTPVLLGALTVLIPCGVTQTILAAAIAAGNPFFGAALVFAFTLGTSPVFFALAYAATKLGSLLEKHLVRITAATLIILGILAFDTGLNLMGSQFSLTRAASSVANEVFNGGEKVGTAQDGTLVLNVIDKGYRPRRLHAPADTPVTLSLVTDEVYSCSRAFLIPDIDFGVILPASGTEVVEIPPQAPGTVMPFTCSMGMYTGEIIFDL
ncbi:MAG: sulfite exporter TauE/SafE family protein [Anaerolineaceae bacterium]|jgi:sulfite exporter TauE/SafE